MFINVSSYTSHLMRILESRDCMGIQDSRDQNQVAKSRHLSMIGGYLHIANGLLVV